MSQIKFEIHENTCNDINVITLTGVHPLQRRLIAKREHNHRTGRATTKAGESERIVDENEWPACVLKLARVFKEDIAILEEENIRLDAIGRELFKAIAESEA